MTDQTIIQQPARHRCRHIFVDGRRCGSASLRHEDFCYYHHTTRRPASNPRTRKARRSSVQLPIPEDRAAIQLSIGLILERLASNDLDPRRAGLLLYGLQIASSNLPPHQQLPAYAKPLPEQPLEEVVTDPLHGLVAPPADALKTRDEMWEDIRREQKILSDREQKLREREDKLSHEKTRFLLDQQNLRSPEPPATTPEPLPLPIPPSCFAPPEAQQRYEAELRAYRESLVLNDVKAQAEPCPARLTTNTGTGKIQPSTSLTIHDHRLQTPHRKDRLPRRGRRIRRVPGLRRDL